jgi:hypothetical protein
MCQVIKPAHHSAEKLKALRQQTHAWCVVCGAVNPFGLKIDFSLKSDGSVESVFAGSAALQGYDGLLHGGVIATLLDGAMTNCLFAHDRVAVTAELIVRYREPVQARNPMTVRAWLGLSSMDLHQLRAELTQNGCVKAVANAKFMGKPGDLAKAPVQAKGIIHA